jgi:hypothetical protein
LNSANLSPQELQAVPCAADAQDSKLQVSASQQLLSQVHACFSVVTSDMIQTHRWPTIKCSPLLRVGGAAYNTAAAGSLAFLSDSPGAGGTTLCNDVMFWATRLHLHHLQMCN